LSVGRQKNAEARWLLPMICRRGSIDKHDIGAIRIYGTHPEFEISGQAAEQFSANVSRPDKEENIRIEALPAGPQGEASSENHADKAASDGKAHEGKASGDGPDHKPSHMPSHKPSHKPRWNDKPAMRAATSSMVRPPAAASLNPGTRRARIKSRGTRISLPMPGGRGAITPAGLPSLRSARSQRKTDIAVEVIAAPLRVYRRR
jgi:hypothetical protein